MELAAGVWGGDGWMGGRMDVSNISRHKNWVGLGWVGLGWVGLDWVGLDWVGLDWIWLGWLRLGWIGFGWIGLGWVGLGWIGPLLELMPPPILYRCWSAGVAIVAVAVLAHQIVYKLLYPA